MTILISIPSGFHARELLIPLRNLLSADNNIEQIYCLSPGAPFKKTIFPNYSSKFTFISPPDTDNQHITLLKKLSPDLVITNTSGLDPKDTPILSAAQNIGIKTLTFIASWDNVWKMERFHRQNKQLVIADHLIVWNKIMRDHLLKAFPSLASSQISIIGAPRLDYFFHHDKIPSRRELFSFLNLPDANNRLIHFATTELYSLDYAIRAIFKAAHSNKITTPLSLYASVHPGGDINKHKKYAQKYNTAIRYSFGRHSHSPHPGFLYNPSDTDIYLLVALFKHADLLINHSSTVAIESFLGQTPVINIKYGRPFDFIRWRRSMVYRDFQQHYRDILSENPTKVVYSARQLINSTNNYLANPLIDQAERQATLKKMITTTDGTAGKKVFLLIKKLASP